MLKHQKEWLTYLIEVRGLSEHTEESYRLSVEKFSYWLALFAEPATSEMAISPSDVNNFLAWCHHQGLCSKSVNVIRVGLNSYYNFCWRYKGYSANPVQETQPMKEPHLLPQYVQQKHIEDVLLSLSSNDFVTARAKALVLIMAQCGLRCSEITGLKRKDIRDNSLIIFGKGCKQRLVPMSANVISALDLLHDLQEINGIISDFVFCRKDGRPLTRSIVYKIIHRIFVNVCPPELAHPHALRHSFATICCLHGVPIPTIQGLMGHSTPATTFKYLSVANTNANPFDTF